jgi:hypothetical protein
MDLFILFKVLSTFLVVIPIVLLTRATGKDMASIYISKGKLRLGLTIGVTLFLIFLATSVMTGYSAVWGQRPDLWQVGCVGTVDSSLRILKWDQGRDPV